MSLCATPLPPDCEKEIQRLVALIPDADLPALVATEPAFQTGGFRSGSKAVVRTRLHQIACGSQEISDTLRRTLARRSRSATLTGLLSPEALADSRHALAALLGKPVLLIALLLDGRREVRAKAEAWLQLPQPFIAMDPDEAIACLREKFADFVSLLGNAPVANAPHTREAWQSQKEKLEGRLRDLQTENRRLKGVDDRLSRTVLKLKACEENLSAVREKEAASEAGLRQKTRELEEATAELAREVTRREERLTAALDLALANEFHGWLANARAVEATASDAAPHNDLLAQADAALKKQRATDRHSGNRAVLAERLEKLETTHQKVRDALVHALRQTPELKAAETALAAEIRSLTQLLEPDAPITPLEEALLAHIHTAHENDLPRLRDLPEQFAPLHVLDDAALDRIRLAFQKRLAAVQAVGVPPDPCMEERQNTTTLLGRALAGQTPAILMIDGHNVLFGLPSRYTPARGASLSEAEKRKRLTDDIARIMAPNPSVRAWVVFDGPTRSDTQASPNVRVTYSGGKGEHRADGVILDNLRFFQSSASGVPVFLVSNDHELCVAARRLGALDIDVLDFGAFL